MDGPAPPGGRPRVGLPWPAIIAAAVLAALVAAWLLLPLQAWVQVFVAAVGTLGAWGPVLYAGTYALALVVLAPGGPLSIGAGFAFGLVGLPVVLVGATAGASLAFLVSRYLLRARVRGLIERRRVLSAVDRAVADEGWRVVGLLRLSPLVPFNLQNYFFGVTRVGFWPYTAATAAGITPGAAFYVYLGMLGRTAGQDAGLLRWALLGAGLLATLAVAAVIGRKARRALLEKGLRPVSPARP